MKGVQNIYHYSYTLSILLVFLVLILFYPALSIYVNTMSSSESLTISSNRTLVSSDGVFELGFFKPSGLSRWYLGIWYKKVSEKTYAWVANRDNPLSNSIGTLKISGNNLVLLGQSNNTVWSTNRTRGNARSSVIAELLPNGNFVMRYSNNKDSSGFLWQSFDFPTDTLLPEMKLGYNLKTGRNRFLTSWRSYDDPSTGIFAYKLDIRRGLPEFILINQFLNQRVEMQRSGPWNGMEFSGIPEVQGLNYMVYNYTENSEEIAYSFHMTNQSIYSRLTVSDYTVDRFTWIPPSSAWNLFWSLPTDVCDPLYLCGSYSYCDLNTSPNCNCIRGFVPKNRQQWDLREGSEGCVRTTQLSCTGDGFLRLNNMKLPDTKTATVDRRIDVKKCEERCLSDCNCTSFATADVRNGGLGCVFWTGDLVEMRKQAVGGQDLYVRLNAADLDFSSGEKRDRTGKIISWSIGVSIMLILSVIVFCFWRRRQKQAKADAAPIGNQVLMNEVVLPRKRRFFSGEDEVENLELPLMEFETVVTATEHFSDFNKVGKGGFGVVYKGRLVDGQEIAVKRLSEMSTQGTDEFMNEVRLIAKLQHNNLVRLLGCCIYEGEKILIYEYLENLSLDSHLFG
ncbi:S-locus-specific glycoprotein S13 isoform X2 [Raphanus sativus]|uniref:non-specific serine/threonine protein kinase n=1 Tax=Raphanus sativus TaxID=3726 RepID=A0A6J0K8J5_RAPSA|nr:S-locus-specific glycoprotein S13 isoform X2 [Raphanus sativus]